MHHHINQLYLAFWVQCKTYWPMKIILSCMDRRGCSQRDLVDFKLLQAPNHRLLFTLFKVIGFMLAYAKIYFRS